MKRILPKAYLVALLCSSAAMGAERGNIACTWSITRMVQVFEDVCRPGEKSDYRTALDEAAAALEARTEELGVVPDFSQATRELPALIKDRLLKDPSLCDQGDLRNMADAARKRSVADIRKDIAAAIATSKENQTNGCLWRIGQLHWRLPCRMLIGRDRGFEAPRLNPVLSHPRMR